LRNAIASARRLRSPPESAETGWRNCSAAEQEFLGVGRDVARDAAHHDLIAACGVKRPCQMVTSHRGCRGADRHRRSASSRRGARCRVRFAPLQEQFEQCGLAAAIGADNADAIAAHEAQ
jgi:hypothetical protein